MANLGEIMVKIGADISEFDRDMNKVGRQLNQLGREMSSSMQTIQDTIRQATDSSGKNWEHLRDRFVQANDQMQAKATQSQKIIDNLSRINTRSLDQQFLRIGDRLEKMARQGAVANVAINELGRNASMKDLYDQIKLINQGLARMQALQLYVGIAFIGINVGLAKMSNIVDGRLLPASQAFKQTWLSALTPFVHAWTTAVVAVINFGTAIGRVFKNFAQQYPLLSQMFWGFVYLTIALTLLLAPLAIGISLTGSFAAAFNVLWASISPLVIGLLSVIGTAMLWAAAIVGVVAAIYYLWTTSEGFRNAVLTIWNAIVSVVSTAVAAVVAFVRSQLVQIQAFWQQNGAQIMSIINAIWGGWVKPYLLNVMKMITSSMKASWAIISTAVKVAWTIIKTVIGNHITLILGVIKAGLQIMKGDWSGAWNTLKSTALKIWGNIKSGIKSIVQDLIDGAKSWGANMVDMFAAGIRNSVGLVVKAASAVADKVKQYLGFSSPTELGPASKSDKWAPNFMNMFTEGINKGVPKLKLAVSDAALTMSELNSVTPVTKGGNTYNVNVNNQTPWSERELIRLFQGMEFLYG